MVDDLTGRAGSPTFAIALTIVLVSWIGLNFVLLHVGRKPIDEPPFFWMQGGISLVALYMVVLILVTQRRENELASHHESLTLELAVLSERKAAKIISLLEELRQDHPDIQDRIDDEAAVMSEPANPQSGLKPSKDKQQNRDRGASRRRPSHAILRRDPYTRFGRAALLGPSPCRCREGARIRSEWSGIRRSRGNTKS
jgi:uncharacterized membrane protein